MGQKRSLILPYFLLVIHAVYVDAAGSGAEATLVLEAPEAVPIGRNATFQCTSVEGNEVQWAVQTPDGNDYVEASLRDIEKLETMWNIHFVPHPSDRPFDQFHNITLVAVATEENNNTIITCNELVEDPNNFLFPMVSNSETDELITIGPPSAPAPSVEARNATALNVSWKEPYIWEGYTIDSYFITIENTSSGEVWNETVNDTFIIVNSEGKALTCVDLVFNVSAESILGHSEPGVVTSGFPIAPGMISDTAVNSRVALQHNHPVITVQFELPNACDFQTANYTISVWKAGQSSAMSKTFGPYQHSYRESSGLSVMQTIPSQSIEQNLDVNTNYTMRIIVTTHGGTSTSGMLAFSTVLPILTAPAAVPLGSNGTFQCTTTEGSGHKVEWVIEIPGERPYDGSRSEDIIILETTWKIHLVHTDEHIITLIALATEKNNNTIIRCRQIDRFLTGTNFSESNFTVIGPPLHPSLSVEALDAAVLHVSWEQPYIFEPYTIDSYTITVENTSSGAVIINETLNATVNDFAFDRKEGIATTCVNLIIRVTAASTLGISEPGTFERAFPVAPGPFDDSVINFEVVFRQNGLTPRVDVEFELPSACNFEMANYTIFVWEDGLENETLTFGPNEFTYNNDRSVKREIPSDSSEPDLASDTEYLMIIEVTTPAGNSTSEMISFCTFSQQTTSDSTPSTTTPPGTVQSSREDDSTDTLSVGVIVGIAVGTSIGAIFVLCLLFLIANSAFQRMKKRRVVVNVRGMVDNPIYVGDEEQYENIEGYQPTFISGPPQIQFIAPAPYAVTGPPPTLPAPRKEKDIEHLAEGCTKSADGLSQVSTGEDCYTLMNAAGPAAQMQRDDQNIYVKSEC